MTKFQFSLDRVLHWRALERASAEAKLRRLIEEEALLESKLRSVNDAISELAARLAALDELRGADLHRMAAYRAQLTHARDRIVALCREKKRAVAEQAEIHRKAKQRHRLLEELRDRKHQEWETTVSRELDELAHESYLARWSSM